MQLKYKQEVRFLLEFGNPNFDISKLCSKNFKDINWKYIVNQAEYHQISPYIYVNLKKSSFNIPERIKNKFKIRYASSFSNYLHLEQEFKKLTYKLIDEKIEFVPLKGFVLIGYLYKEPIVRPVADIDILVKPENLPKIDRILKEHGYKKTFAGLSDKYYRKHHCHYMYMKKNILFEIHWALSFNRPYKIEIPNLWQRIQDYKFESLNLKALSIEDNIIALALHQRRFDKPLYLKSLLDVHILVKKFQSEINWDYIIKIAFKNKLKHLSYLIFFIINQLFNTPIPDKILNRFYPGYFKKKFIQKLIKKYLFHPRNHTYNFRKSFYLKLNLIWYDTLWDTLSYILWLSQEKFAKYYNLDPYSYKTSYLYKFRFVYIPFNMTAKLFKKYFSKPVNRFIKN